MEKFKDVMDEIRNANPNVCFKVMPCKELKENFLFAYVPFKKARTIQVFREGQGTDEQAHICFSISPIACYVSSFKVKADLQQKGIGRTLFNMACAISDLKGVTTVWGIISPIDDIKGVSDNSVMSHFREQKALIDIYAKLGNRIDEDMDGGCIFITDFMPGKRIAKLNNEQVKFLKMIDKIEKKLDKQQ